MKRIMYIISLLSFCLILSGCSTSNKTDDKDGKSETSKNSPIDDLYEGKFYFDGKEYQLPMTMKDFMALEFVEPSNRGSGTMTAPVHPNYISYDSFYELLEDGTINDNNRFWISVYNSTNKSLPRQDCLVTSISIYEWCQDRFSISGDIKVGDAKEDVITVYGEPTNTYKDTNHKMEYLQYHIESSYKDDDGKDKSEPIGVSFGIDSETNTVESFSIKRHK